MTSAFCPIDYSSALEAAGVSKAQAQAHAKALDTVLADVAYTHDLAKVEGNLQNEIRQCEERLTLRIDGFRIELNANIEQVRTELNAKIEQVRTELNAKIEQVRTELNAKIEQVRAELNAKIDVLTARTDARFDAISAELVMHRWVLGLLVAVSGTTLALVARLMQILP
jgi:DNA anti-recombination protein RmuC